MPDDGVVLARHRMVRCDPAAWATMLAATPELRAQPLLVEWARRGWPLVGRRLGDGDDARTTVPLGLPLPPAQGRARLALRLPPAALIDHAPPPRLVDAAAAAPADWRRTIDALARLDAEVRCFGSLAWEHLTGLPYLTDGSDLDLVWQVRTRAQADVLTEALAALAGDAPMRLDGELVNRDGVAVQWREWRSPAAELLAKSPHGAWMIERDAWIS